MCIQLAVVRPHRSIWIFEQKFPIHQTCKILEFAGSSEPPNSVEGECIKRPNASNRRSPWGAHRTGGGPPSVPSQNKEHFSFASFFKSNLNMVFQDAEASWVWSHSHLWAKNSKNKSPLELLHSSTLLYFFLGILLTANYYFSGISSVAPSAYQ